MLEKALIFAERRRGIAAHCKWNHLENIVASYVKNC